MASVDVPLGAVKVIVPGPLTFDHFKTVGGGRKSLLVIPTSMVRNACAGSTTVGIGVLIETKTAGTRPWTGPSSADSDQADKEDMLRSPKAVTIQRTEELILRLMM